MKKTLTLIGASLALAGCATGPSDQEISALALKTMKASFRERGQAKLDRLDQDETQRLCSSTVSKEASAKIEKINTASLRYPADGKLMGDWRQGERIAQSGVGKQFSDNPAVPAGGNCYACHQLSKAEISYGTIGPSLYNFGKIRGNSEAVQRYTYGKVYNPQAFTACSNMPRFGHNGILTEAQLRDVVALLLDPESPVNK
jgi:sulfur-oxidizing protein SoxX